MDGKNSDVDNSLDAIYKEICRLRSEGMAAALATVVAATGSTPGRPLFKMLVYSNGEILGTVGGGSFEKKVISEALGVIKNKTPLMFDFKFSQQDETSTNDQPICGGENTVFIEPISLQLTLYIMGAGHIGQALARIAKVIGFRVVVVDDRKEFANEERFPGVDRIIVTDFEKVADEIDVDKSSYIVIVTHGHTHGQYVLKELIGSSAAYIGMIGSKKKVEEVKLRLLAQGIERDLLDSIYSPIGIDIGAQTPAEIAISITAQLIAHKYGRGRNLRM